MPPNHELVSYRKIFLSSWPNAFSLHKSYYHLVLLCCTNRLEYMCRNTRNHFSPNYTHTNFLSICLTGGNWQKWKRVFLTWPCHKIYIGMKQLVWKVAKILEKLRYLWKCEIWGNIVKIWYFVNNCLIKARILKILLHMCDTYNYDYLKHSTFRFNFIYFQLYIDFPFQFCVFYRKIT